MKKLDTYLQELIEREVVPGMAISVITKENIWKNYYGVMDLDTKEPIQEDILFDLASLTKVMLTNTGILRLVEKGIISFQTPLQEILDDFSSNTTIEQCLLHTSGFLAGQIDYQFMKKEELIQAVLHHPVEQKYVGTPVYSDVNFILLGWVLEKLTGKSLQEYGREEIFLPLGMKDTDYGPREEKRCCGYEKINGQTIRGRVHDGKAYLLGGISGHAGLFSTLDEVTNFFSYYFKEDSRILSRDMYQSLKEVRASRNGKERTYGWMVQDAEKDYLMDQGGIRLFHSGFTGNYVLIDYEKEYAVCILSNRIHPSRENKKIMDHLKEIYRIVEEEK